MSIARAMLKRAKIICFDEATSALDNETEHYVQEAIDNVCRLGYDYEDDVKSGYIQSRPTIMIIAHRLSTVRNCNKIIVMDQGKIKEVGSHDELLVQGGKYSELWSIQAEQKESKKDTKLDDKQE